MIKGKNYEITKKNILGHEIIGLRVKVIQSTDEGKKGFVGKVVDETQKTLKVIEEKSNLKNKTSSKKEIVLPKEECVFEFNLNDEEIVVNGKEILKRPEDRVKDWRG